MLWQKPENFPDLKKGQVHVWRASLDRTKEEIEEFQSLLNAKEIDRANRFVVSDARNKFVVARGILRTFLSNYLNMAPQEIVFKQNEYGKLYLESSPLQFNLSHSSDLSLFIFTLDNVVGVDVEFIRKIDNFEDIAKKFFSKKEAEDIFSLPEDERLLAFFNCWSRKEAYIKAKGLGVYHGLDNFSVEISVKKKGKVDLICNDDNWHLEACDPGENYSGAFAINAPECFVVFYEFKNAGL